MEHQKPSQTFSLFEKLPAELRLRVWYLLLLQPDPITIDVPASTISWDLATIAPLPRTYSPLLFTCRESRHIALRSQQLGFSVCHTVQSTRKRGRYATPYEASGLNHNIYWNPSRDIVLFRQDERVSGPYCAGRITLDERIRYLAMPMKIFLSLRMDSRVLIPGLETLFVVMEDTDRKEWAVFTDGWNQRMKERWTQRMAFLGMMYTKNSFHLGKATRHRLEVQFVDDIQHAQDSVQLQTKAVC